MITTILFDFGNVLGGFDHARACTRLARYTNVDASELFNDLYEKELLSLRQTGKLSAKDFYDFVQEEYSLTQECDYIMFSEIWGDIFYPAPAEIYSLVSNLRSDIVSCIASNTEELHWHYACELPVVKKFKVDNIFRSYQVGAEKPEKNFFQKIITTLYIQPQEVLFIDDVQEYVDIFSSLGGSAEVFNFKLDEASRLEEILTSASVLR